MREITYFASKIKQPKGREFHREVAKILGSLKPHILLCRQILP